MNLRYPVGDIGFSKHMEILDSLVTEDVKAVIAKCDEILDGKDVTEMFLSALIVKTVLSLGYSDNVICRLRMKDYTFSINHLFANGQNIRLPDNTGAQFRKFYEYRKQENAVSDDSILFSIDGKCLVEDRYAVLNGKMDASELPKSKICQLIYEGVSKKEIMNFTECSKRFYTLCADIVSDRVQVERLDVALETTGQLL